MKKDNILEIMRSKNTVFTSKDIALIWNKSNPNALKKKIHRYIKTGKMYSIRRGLYAKDKNYDKFELATKIFTPSYVSFETVLAKAGFIFQFYGQIFIASYLSREIVVDGQTYIFKKIKDSVLTNNAGIENKGNYFITSPERAFLDVVYLNKDYHFDNLSGLNWDKVFEILPIYHNKRMENKIEKYRAGGQKETN
jgi:predicted transcriptional regulator of viral defense system